MSTAKQNSSLNNIFKILIITLLLFSSISFSQTSFGDFFDGVAGNLTTQGQGFVQASTSAGSTVGVAGRSVYDAFVPSSCGYDWISSNLQNDASPLIVWLAPAAFMAVVVVVAITLIYMIGQFFGNPQLIALAKEEGYQSALTLFRIGFIAAALITSNLFYSLNPSTSAVSGDPDPIYSHNPSMIDAAMAFSRQMVSDMVTHYGMLVLYNTVVHTIYSSTMWFGVTWRAMYSFNLGPILRPVIDVLSSTLQFMSLGMTEWLLHIVTLCLIKRWMWGLLIPLGILLRSFPYTRSAGEALIALCFALVLIYPFMFLFDYEAHKIMKNYLVDSKDAMTNFVHRSGLLSVFGSVFVSMFLMAGVFIPFFLGGALTLAFELIRSSIYYVVIISLVLPFLNIFVTLTMAKETAKFFNVDVNYMSFLKLI